MRDGKVSGGQRKDVSGPLLNWYDRHARVMPWRVSPQDRALGVAPDPYRVWMSEVMLQQTTVAAVRAYFHRFTQRWPTVADLAAAEDGAVMAEWAGLGYYARARNLLACARAVMRDHAGVFPGSRDGLLTLPGVGPYTAAAIASIAYGEPATVVDGNVERVVARLFAVEALMPGAKPELVRLAETITPRERAGDYAQAMMDLGATICTPRNPVCALCPINTLCDGYAKGIAASLPRKAAKAAKPVREGCVWVVIRPDGAVVLERRVEKGLLGGMLGLPGDGWDGAGGEPPILANWQDIGEVRHTFTHFHLVLRVFLAESSAAPLRGAYRGADTFHPSDLPTLMRKAYDLASAAISPR